MLKTEKKLIITFATTTDVISAEKLLKKDSSELGSIIPLPSKISAGCGLAWSASIDKKEKILELFKNGNIEYDEIYEIEI